MNFLLENYNWALLLAALVSGGLLAWPVLGRLGQGGLDPAAAVTLINREKAVLIDVGDAEAYAKGHAAGAKNIPLAQLATSTALPKKKNLPVILLCPTGSRAGRAVPVLKKLGFENCRTLNGGTAAWRQAGLPIESQPAAG